MFVYLVLLFVGFLVRLLWFICWFVVFLLVSFMCVCLFCCLLFAFVDFKKKNCVLFLNVTPVTLNRQTKSVEMYNNDIYLCIFRN